MPILGQFGGIGAANFFVPGGAFESIATVTVGSGGAANIEFTSIPSTYQHLQIRMISPYKIQDAVFDLRMNNVTSGYTYHELRGNGSAAGAAAGTGQSRFSFAYDGNASPRDSQFVRVAVVDILDYGSTTKNKTLRTFGGVERNGSGYVEIRSGLFPSTAAVSSILLRQTGFDGSSYGFKNFAQHTTAALYGLRAP